MTTWSATSLMPLASSTMSAPATCRASATAPCARRCCAACRPWREPRVQSACRSRRRKVPYLITPPGLYGPTALADWRKFLAGLENQPDHNDPDIQEEIAEAKETIADLE